MAESLLSAKAVFDRAHEISSPEERRTYLDEACGANGELRRQVEALLRAYDEAGSFMDQPAATSDVAPGQWRNAEEAPSPPLEGVGSRIKQYKLLQQIGEGGMGVVFMAEQQEPVRRMVALKVIKAGMDSAQVIARFEAERQALALMDHPNIAKVLDAGTTASGRPFFVMELVKGIPITKYCDEQRLTPKQRLELFVPVCQAIQHAHQKGIIHRDIKPSNVLIAAYDGRPVPKVIDFGVAKATGGKLTERTLFTGFGGLIGTLEYMSPEQAEFNALDIDTRSDVYALGVLLYELLIGTTPLSRQRIKDAAIMEVLRLIREEEPPRPSTRLSESRDSLASVSAHRQLEPVALVKAIRGEVDWIVMKALEKDRGRRYDTANGLARDIQRYLADEPVEAGPPSARYRLRKLAWKHRRGLTTAALLLALVLIGSVVSTLLAIWALRAEGHARVAERQALQERDRATEAERQALQERDRAAAAEKDAKAQRDEAKAAHQATAQQRDRALKAEREAKQSAENTKAVLEFFQDKVLSAGRPEGREGGLGPKVTLRKAVDQAEKDIGPSFADHPLVEASIRHTLGQTYWYLGDYPQAIRQHQRSIALCEAHLGSDDPHTLAARHNLANAYKSAGRIDEAIRLCEQTLKQRETKLGADHPDTIATRNNLAGAYWSANRIADAVPLLEQILPQREAKLGNDHPDTLLSRNNLASAYWRAGRIAEAIRLHERNLKLYEAKLGIDHPDTLRCRGNLAAALMAAGRIAEAIRLLEQNLNPYEAKFGTDHPATLGNRHNLAAAYLSARRIPKAVRLLEQNLKQYETKLGTNHPDTLRARGNLASAYLEAGRIADAIRLYEPILQQQEAQLGPDHPDTLKSRHNLASAYFRVGRTADAFRLYEQNLKRSEAKLGTDHPDTQHYRDELALAYFSTDRVADAIPLLERNAKQYEAKFGAVHPRTIEARGHLVSAYDRAGQFAKSEPLYRAALELARQRFGADDARTAVLMAELGSNLVLQHKYTDAEPLLRDCLTIRQAKQPANWTTFNAQAMLGGALLGQKKYADAEPLLLTGYQGMKQREAKIPQQGKVRLTEALERLVQLYQATGKKDETAKWRKELSAAKTAGKK